MEREAVEQRASQRVQVIGMPLGFFVRSRRQRELMDAGRVRDVGGTGASIQSLWHPELIVGTLVTIDHEGARGTASIKWIRTHASTKSALFGIEYVKLEPSLRDYLVGPAKARSSEAVGTGRKRG